MKCKCASCKSVLYINDKDLMRQKKPQFNCPQCKTKILILPNKAKCGKCFKVFGYYKFMIKDKKAICECPNCKGLNNIIKT